MSLHSSRLLLCVLAVGAACDSPAVLDGGAPDAGTLGRDAGAEADAGQGVDSGLGVDSGPRIDGGSASDAGADSGPRTPPLTPTGLRLLPESPTTAAELVVEYEAESAVEVLVEWWRNGARAEISGPTVPSYATQRGDRWEARVVAHREGLSSADARVETTVINSAPSAPMMEIIALADGLLCRVSTAATDADSDPLTYAVRWTLDGVAEPSETLVWQGDRIAAAVSGQSWTCVAQADDGAARSADSLPVVWDVADFTQPMARPFGNTTCHLDSSGHVRCVGHDGQGQVRDAPSQRFRSLHGSGGVVCGLDADQRATCWGNTSGGGAPPAEPLTSICTGVRFGCGLDASSALRCWGLNQNGQADPPTGSFVQVTCAPRHACARAADGRVECWGEDDQGQSTPPPASRFVDVSVAGTGFSAKSCGVTTEGDLRCWGAGSGLAYDRDGSLAQVAASSRSACTLDAAGVVECAEQIASNVEATTPSVPLLDLRASAADHFCGTRVSDRVPVCWGVNTRLQTEPPDITGVAQIEMGSTDGCIRFLDGSVQCWRANSLTTTLDAPMESFRDVATGRGFACGIRSSDGFTTCWGTPPAVPGDQLFPDIAATDDELCAISQDGASILCFGAGDVALVAAAPPFVEVEASPDGVLCGVDSAGALACQGAPVFPEPVHSLSRSGDCGIAAAGTLSCPNFIGFGLVPPPGTYESVETYRRSATFACAARASDSSLTCWGTSSSPEAPRDPPPGPLHELEFTHMFGAATGCAIDATDTLRCWGWVAR